MINNDPLDWEFVKVTLENSVKVQLCRGALMINSRSA